MSCTGVCIVLTGLVIVGVSIAFRSHSADKSNDMLAVHSRMTDDDVEKQLSNRPTNSVAYLGIAVGSCFVVMGLLWIIADFLFVAFL